MTLKLKLAESQIPEFLTFSETAKIYPTVTYSVEGFMSTEVKLFFTLTEEQAAILKSKYPQTQNL